MEKRIAVTVISFSEEQNWLNEFAFRQRDKNKQDKQDSSD